MINKYNSQQSVSFSANYNSVKAALESKRGIIPGTKRRSEGPGESFRKIVINELSQGDFAGLHNTFTNANKYIDKINSKTPKFTEEIKYIVTEQLRSLKKIKRTS